MWCCCHSSPPCVAFLLCVPAICSEIQSVLNVGSVVFKPMNDNYYTPNTTQLALSLTGVTVPSGCPAVPAANYSIQIQPGRVIKALMLCGWTVIVGSSVHV